MGTYMTASRFFNRIDYSTTGCWSWTGRLRPDGYGRVMISRKSYYAHRIAYSLLKGKIPEGLTIDHLCRNRSCVNPDHLEAVTIQENISRRPTSGIGVGSRTRIHIPKVKCKRGHLLSRYRVVNSKGFSECKKCRNISNYKSLLKKGK